MKQLKDIALPVSALLLASALLLLLVHEQTIDRVRDNAREHELAVVKQLMTLAHDNQLLDDTLTVTDAHFFSGRQATTVYRARQGNTVVGVVFRPVFARGYSGPIELAIALGRDGAVLGVATIRQNETPGLGDQVDEKKSAWLSQFNAINSADMQATDWDIRTGGGRFDQISGATVTSRAVIESIQETLEYHRLYHAKLYEENLPDQDE